MHRFGTWFVVAAVGTVALVAAADALFRGDDRSSSAVRERDGAPGEPLTGAARLAEELREAGIRGQLVWSTPGCDVRVLNLPELEEARPPEVESCAFTVSPGGQLGFDGEVSDPGGDVQARCRGGEIEIRGRLSGLSDHIDGCAPAWNREGQLTFVRDGALMLFGFCEDARSCEYEVVTRRDFARELAPDPWGFRSPMLEEVGWLRTNLFAAIVSDGARGSDVIGLFRGRRLLAALPNPYEDLSTLRVSPLGTYVAARVEEPSGLVLLDATGRPLPSELRGATAITWSPDERWTATAAVDGVYISAAGVRATRLFRIPLEATDVFWR
jgi:hypothetical protein